MSTTNLLHDTGLFLHEQIPLTRAMGVQVEAYDKEQLIVTAPLAPNHNHVGTAFGGSLSAIATLTGYCMLWLLLGDRESHIVIRNSSMNYRRPVRQGIRAVCRSIISPRDNIFDYGSASNAGTPLRHQQVNTISQIT
jgi:thioesterase domain-containing protein